MLDPLHLLSSTRFVEPSPSGFNQHRLVQPVIGTDSLHYLPDFRSAEPVNRVPVYVGDYLQKERVSIDQNGF